MWPPSFELVRSHRLDLANLVIATWVMWFYVVRSAFVSYFYWPHAPVVIFIARCSDPQNVWTNPFSYIFSIFSIHGSGNDSFCEEPCFRAFACVYGQSCAVYPRYNWVLCSPSARVSFEWMCGYVRRQRWRVWADQHVVSATASCAKKVWQAVLHINRIVREMTSRQNA